ncbi:MAG: type II secretion system protein M [Proteobacteria bacterium]|nr:type II secretion system protein M [Pseudomonadota bacterium]
MNALRRWYASLKERERRVVLGGAVALALLILFGGLLMPLHTRLVHAQEKLAAQRDDLAWMQQHAAEIQAAAGTFVPTGDESPIVLIDRTGREAGLAEALRGTQPSGDAGVRVQLESAPFDALVSWLGVLEQRHGIAIESVTIDRTVRPGLVNASISLNQKRR